MFNALYALGEAQYSGKNLRVTVFYTFLSRVDFNLKVNMTKLFVRSNILDGWLMFTFSNYQQKCLGNLQRCKKQVPVTSKVTDTLCSSID